MSVTRGVYIGGFGNGKKSVERVAYGIEAQEDGDLEDIDTFTFAHAMDNPDKLRQALIGAKALMHSAGIMAATEAIRGRTDGLPRTMNAYNPPLPTPLSHFVGKTVKKTWEMHTQESDKGAVIKYDLSSAAEFIAHPLSNLTRLPMISRFDSIAAAKSAQDRGIDTALAFSPDDRYFYPTPEQVAQAEKMGVNIVYLTKAHDYLVLNPEETLAAFHKLRSESE